MTYNDLHNEGGQGYDPNNTAAKRLERDLAEIRMVDRVIADYASRLIAAGFVDAAATQARRERWNAMVRSGEITTKTRTAAERKLGWTLIDLAGAIKHYGVK